MKSKTLLKYLSQIGKVKKNPKSRQMYLGVGDGNRQEASLPFCLLGSL
jgi:hypothetical protein